MEPKIQPVPIVRPIAHPAYRPSEGTLVGELADGLAFRKRDLAIDETQRSALARRLWARLLKLGPGLGVSLNVFVSDARPLRGDPTHGS